MPFVQGHLRREVQTFAVSTECAHCGQALHLELDRDLNCRVVEKDSAPLVFSPKVDFANLEDPSIIDAY